MRIFTNNVEFINVDNHIDARNLVKQGFRELSPQEIETAGMTGYEHLVSSSNTVVNSDGNIIFTPPKEPSLEKLKEQKIKQIDKETSESILSGFDYIINNTEYHFSYDSFDQQNFADTANMCQLALSGVEGLPATVTWNSYLEDGTLVQQEFDANSFLKLYISGAMVHKATQMAIGGQRKAAVQLVSTKEELDNI